VPIFGNGILNNPHAMSSSANTGVAAQVHLFHQRQNELFASTQRRIQQDAAMGRQSDYGPSSHSAQFFHSQSAEHYHSQHRAPLPTKVGSSANLGAAFASESPLNIQQDFHEVRATKPDQTYQYVNDELLSQICYSPTIPNGAFNPRLSIDSHSKAIPVLPSVSLDDAGIVQNTPPDANHIGISNSNSECISSSLVTHRDSSGSDTRPTDLGNDPDFQSEEEDINARLLSVKPSEVVTEAEADGPTFYDTAIDDFEGTDSDWLYTLHTECSKPGVECQCGDSCCCPGCFTHTNNPGDRDVYNKMVGKMAAMLEPENEGLVPENDESCHLTTITDEAKV
jgi:hypothetical protein